MCVSVGGGWWGGARSEYVLRTITEAQFSSSTSLERARLKKSHGTNHSTMAVGCVPQW